MRLNKTPFDIFLFVNMILNL